MLISLAAAATLPTAVIWQNFVPNWALFLLLCICYLAVIDAFITLVYSFLPSCRIVNNILDIQMVFEEQGVGQKCIDSAPEHLIECVQDGPNVDDPMAGSSLDVQTGCCTKKCADGIKKVKAYPNHYVSSNCH